MTTDLNKLLADAASSAKAARGWARALENIADLRPEDVRDAARAIRGFVGDLESLAKEIARLVALNGELVAACRLALGAFKLETYEGEGMGIWSCGECGRSVPTRQQSMCAEFHAANCPRMVILALIEEAKSRGDTDRE